MAVIAYCMEWHLTASDAFQKILREPLAGHLDVVLRAWDGEVLPEPLAEDSPTIFCQYPPPPSAVAESAARVVWVPMLDDISWQPQEWWGTLPSSLAVVAFSSGVERRARAAGLETLRLRYFADPDELPLATWDSGPVVFYWNRTGLVGPRFLEALCSAIGARELLFRPQLDPRIPEERGYSLPDRIGGTSVTPLELTARDEFIRATEPANVVIAPRECEGAGLIFLEAMARGCCVIAYDGPTMNEYVTSARTGILMANPSWERYVFNRRWSRQDPYRLSHRQRWRRISSLDLEELGTRAREEHLQGRREWLAGAERYRDFVLGR